MVRKSIPSPRILQSSITALALTLSTATLATAAPIEPPQKVVDLFAQRLGGSAVPGAGVEESDVAAGATFTGFGIPSINEQGAVAVIGRYKSPTDKGTVTAVFAGAPLALIAKKGAEAPLSFGSPGSAVFSSFRDPLISETGKVAFLAKLADYGLGPSNSTALFSNATSIDGRLVRVIQAGDYAPGIDGSPRIRKIMSVAMTSRVGQFPESTIFFTATLTIGDAGVTRDNDFVLFQVSQHGEVTPVLREGDEFESPSGTSTVKSFRTLVARSGSAGQGRGAACYENLIGTAYGSVLVTSTKGEQAVGRYSKFGFELKYFTGNQVDPFGDDALWKGFGVPTQNSESGLSFIGKLKSGNVTSANNVGIFVEDDYTFDPLPAVSKGDSPDGIPSAAFASFKDPVNASGRRVAFAAKVSGATPADDQGIWFSTFGVQRLVAREGSEPVGVPGAKWASFISLALPDGEASGPLFVAKLAQPKAGEPNPANILSSNSTGLWGRDGFGNLHLIARYGETINVNGEDKTVRSFVVLKAVSGSPAQSRFFNNQGEIYYRAICTDGTQALMRVTMPGLPQ